MKRPGYLIFVLIFLIEKFLQNLSGNFPFISSYADDVLIIPLVLGAALIIQQKFVKPDFVFRKVQILLTCVYFSIIFELIIPRFNPAYTIDLLDIAAYGTGAILYYFFLNHPAEKVKE